MKSGDFLVRLRERMPEFSKGQRAIARYILSNYDKASYMTAVQLGQASGVSESTVVRFAGEMGCDGYPDFQKKLADYVGFRLSMAKRLEIAVDEMDFEEQIDFVMGNDMENLRKTWENLDRNAVNEAVDSLLAARHIYVIGVRSCSAIAHLLTFYLRFVFDNVTLVSNSGSTELLEQLIRVGAKDVVIGISFPRYSMGTIKALEFANDRNAKIIAITDNKHSPLNLYSSCNLFAPSNMSSVVDSFTAPVSLLNVLMVSLCMRKRIEVLMYLDGLEKAWKDYQVVHSDELDYLDEADIKDFD